MVFRAGEGAGASGSFFFFSHDNRFLIKTMHKSEKDKFLSILDEYIQHIKDLDNKSLLARIYGVFTIKSNVFAPLDIMIMQNTAVLTDKTQLKNTFDLKGSLIGRKTPYIEGLEGESKKVLKDVNLLEFKKKNKELFNITREQHSELSDIIKADSDFLKS